MHKLKQNIPSGACEIMLSKPEPPTKKTNYLDVVNHLLQSRKGNKFMSDLINFFEEKQVKEHMDKNKGQQSILNSTIFKTSLTRIYLIHNSIHQYYKKILKKIKIRSHNATRKTTSINSSACGIEEIRIQRARTCSW